MIYAEAYFSIYVSPIPKRPPATRYGPGKISKGKKLSDGDYQKKYQTKKGGRYPSPTASNLEMVLLSTLTEELLDTINGCPIVFKRAIPSPSKSRQSTPRKNLNNSILQDGCLTLGEDYWKFSECDLQQL